MAKTIKVGDKVMWRGTWGTESPKEAKILSIELCKREHEKYGEEVSQVSVKDLHRCVVDLDNGHWAYGYQIKPLN